MTRLRLVIDALQVPEELSGVATEVMAIGRALQRAPISDVQIELRCSEAVAAPLSAAFAPDTRVVTPIPSSKPVRRRLFWQQLVGPWRDRRGTIVLCAADQAPLMSLAPVILIAFDVRRLEGTALDSRADTLFYRAVQPPSIIKADVILTLSAFSARQIGVHARPRQMPRVVAHHPAPRAAAESRPAPNAPLLVVGALRRYKGVGDAVRALALVGNEAPQLVFAGGGDPAPYISLASELGISHRVRFAGWIPDEERDALYASALAVVAPSHYEGYGLSVAEGAAWGRPVLASSIPPHLEILGNAGATFPASDIDALAARITELSDPSRWSELSRLSAERSAELATAEPDWDAAIATAVSELVPRVRRTRRSRR